MMKSIEALTWDHVPVQAYELPSQALVWSIMKRIVGDDELKKERVLLNHLSKNVLVTFVSEQQAWRAYGFLDKKKVVFKAPRVSAPPPMLRRYW